MTDLRSAILPVEGFDVLLQESIAEGYDMLRRLIDDWEADRNRFSRLGERLLSAHKRGRLVGICGRSIDPYTEGPRIGRVRRLYVRREARRQGVGRDLLGAIIADADAHFDKMHVRAPAAAFSFYRAMGFERLDRDPFATHRLTFIP